MIYFAHRGASAQAPANTQEAFALARAQGATCYELDVQLTADGRLPVWHDYQLAAGGKNYPVKDFTWMELFRFCQEHDLPRPALLEEIFPVVRENLEILNIEIKNDGNLYPGIERVLWRQLTKTVPELLPHVLISSFDYPTLLRLRALAPQARLGLLTRAFDPQQAHALPAYSVHINHTRLTPQMVQTCHEQGQKVFVYTVNDRAAAQQLAQQGVDGIFTDEVGAFLARPV